MMTLVCGGAASGKSAYAEALVCGIQSPSEDRNLSGLLDSAHRFYIATMQPFGKEAEERIRKHRAMRADKGFETMECFTAGTIRGLSLPPGAAVLLEDLGNLCANELFSETESKGQQDAVSAADPVSAAGPDAAADSVISAVSALRQQCSELAIVANEVFSGGADYAGETLSYLRLLGQVSTALAAMSERVVEVQCGIPVVLKDAGPESGTEAGNRAGTETGKEAGTKAGTEEKRAEMVFVTGPLFSGKRKAAAELLGIPAEEIRVCGNGEQDIRKKQSSGIAEVQILAAGCRDEKELEQLADKLSEYDVVISSETGCGVVPADPAVREAREKAGRLNCLLAARASEVVRVFCGIPQVIKR